MGKASRDKGQRGEREVAAKILKWFGVKWVRTPLSGGLDIKSDIRKPYGGKRTICDLFHWEVKFQETTKIWEWLEQAENDALKDPNRPIPIVPFRRSRSEWKVALNLDDFLDILLELHRLRLQKDVPGSVVDPPPLAIGASSPESFPDWVVSKGQKKRIKLQKKYAEEELKEKYAKKGVSNV